MFNLGNVPSAVWIDEEGYVRRIDEGTYATMHKMGDFEFGREDYAPMVADWVRNGANVDPVGEFSQSLEPRSSDESMAEAAFALASFFKTDGNGEKADKYWAMAQRLNPDSWNYHRQDWSFTPEEAGSNWQRKVMTLGDKPYYRPIDGLDHTE